MPERAHNINAEFDPKYLGKEAIKLESYSCTCINLKIVLKIPVTTIVQLVSKSSLVKKGINIREKIIDTEYIENIIAMLQNDLKKAYTIEPNKKIVQAIFLSLVKIAQLMSMGNKKELEITARGISEFGFMKRVDILVNMAKKEIVNKREIISTHQPISILPYNQYIVAIEKKVKD
ncbi:hypothetical protein G9A89_014424 [Geosiphon pyriformis]|nr:hypothetical protein G9A89_014424 [Geosiphon pyriformis]